MKSMLPKYYLIKESIINKINKEEIYVNELLPSERELMEEYKVSRITVRRAIEELEKEGYIYKIQGKGSFVKGDHLKQGLTKVHSYTESIQQQGMKPSRKVLYSNIEKPDKKRRNIFNIQSEEDLFVLERIYYADQDPICVTKAMLPYKLFPKIECFDFSNHSLYAILENFYHLKITRATQSLEAVIAPEHVSQHLNLGSGFPVLLFRAVTFGMINNVEVPFETYKSYYKTDKIKYYIDQVR
ncbi:GntR family transcriptional regulator [Inediibacterium massiliense]|uniref:GntR family transcriptional regulator n=1 Tax=Inediibacterium massiliense TaxID=1658111 RepID=UPI0006B570B7|nr:GntR family transcriptional regulator [Inediibacterium massiliense]